MGLKDLFDRVRTRTQQFNQPAEAECADTEPFLSFRYRPEPVDEKVLQDVRAYRETPQLKARSRSLSLPHRKAHRPSRTRRPARHASLYFMPSDKRRMLNEDDVKRIYTTGCGCERQCLWSITLTSVFASRLAMAKKSRAERRLAVIQKLREHRVDTRSHHTRFEYLGPQNERLCLRAWQVVFGIGGKLYAAARKIVLDSDGDTQVLVRSLGCASLILVVESRERKHAS